MNRKKSERIVKEIVKDINNTINELRRINLIRDERGLSEKMTGVDSFEISFSGKTSANSIMMDKNVSAFNVMNKLLQERQYTILLYDKGIEQAEFCIKNGELVKERLVFLKRHNQIWEKKEIQHADAEDEDWFAEEGIPVFIRIDYDPFEHIECDHPSAHLTLSNYESCRIPMKNVVSFSLFI